MGGFKGGYIELCRKGGGGGGGGGGVRATTQIKSKLREISAWVIENINGYCQTLIIGTCTCASPTKFAPPPEANNAVGKEHLQKG